MKKIIFTIIFLGFLFYNNYSQIVTHFVVGNKIVIQTTSKFVSHDFYYSTGGEFNKIPVQQLVFSPDNSTALWTGWKFTTEDLQNLIIKSEIDIEPEMVFVEGGTYQMGSEESYDTEPVHTVSVDDFYIGKYEITNAQFCAFLNDYGSDKVKSGKYAGQTMITYSNIRFDGEHDFGIHKEGNHWVPAKGYEETPVIYVTWYGANEYCKWLSEKTGKHYRLPTEAEWEFAARGGNKSHGYKFSGGNDIDEVAWYLFNTDNPKPVGTKKPNELGIYDMSGNVWELCYDWYDENYYRNSPRYNPQGPETGEYHVERGGSYDTPLRYCTVYARGGLYHSESKWKQGFRVARTP